MHKFELNEQQKARVTAWLKDEVYPDVIAKQKESGTLNGNPIAEDCWKNGFPYGGAIGGGVTYMFTPTSIGVVEKVESYGKELDLTEYDLW